MSYPKKPTTTAVSPARNPPIAAPTTTGTTRTSATIATSRCERSGSMAPRSKAVVSAATMDPVSRRREGMIGAVTSSAGYAHDGFR